MKAKRAFPYATRQMRAGETFEADCMTDALLLEQGGHAERDTTETTERRAYKRRDMRAEH